MILHTSHTLPHTGLPVSNDTMQPFERWNDFKTFVSLQRMLTQQHRKPLLHCADFYKQLTQYLPEVIVFFDENDFGIVHLEVGAMKLATLDAFARSDFTAIRKHLFLIADLFDRADAMLYDAIRISYLEALFLGETSANHIVARGMLSRQMENVLRQAELRLDKKRAAQTTHTGNN